MGAPGDRQSLGWAVARGVAWEGKVLAAVGVPLREALGCVLDATGMGKAIVDFLGSLLGSTSPVSTATPLLGAELAFLAGSATGWLVGTLLVLTTGRRERELQRA